MIDLKMKSVEVKAETRALRATWTPHMAADLSSQYGFDDVSGIEAALMKEWERISRTSKRMSKTRKIYES